VSQDNCSTTLKIRENMRTSEIKIEGVKKEAVLVAGGAGFKVYSVAELDGWALAIGGKVSFIKDHTLEAQTVADYVNIRYHSIDSQEQIKKKFESLILFLGNKGKAPTQEAPF